MAKTGEKDGILDTNAKKSGGEGGSTAPIICLPSLLRRYGFVDYKIRFFSMALPEPVLKYLFRFLAFCPVRTEGMVHFFNDEKTDPKKVAGCESRIIAAPRRQEFRWSFPLPAGSGNLTGAKFSPPSLVLRTVFQCRVFELVCVISAGSSTITGPTVIDGKNR